MTPEQEKKLLHLEGKIDNVLDGLDSINALLVRIEAVQVDLRRITNSIDVTQMMGLNERLTNNMARFEYLVHEVGVMGLGSLVDAADTLKKVKDAFQED